MAKLINKLNTLVRASVQGLLGNDPDRARQKLGKDLDKEVAALRERANAALDDEDRMIQQVEAVRRQAADWDRQADVALEKGDDATARYAVRQMHLAQQRAAMIEAELAQHRLAASELIRRVNELEALVAEADQHRPTAFPAPEKTQAEDEGQVLTQNDSTPEITDEKAVEDDLARRRARLSQ
jgi:phage shock protein A